MTFQRILTGGLIGAVGVGASSALYDASTRAQQQFDNVVEYVQDVVEPCQMENQVDLLTCELNENGYNVNRDTVQDLVKTLYFEADPTMGQHEYDSIATSMRNQYDTARVWETMDDRYPKGNTIEQILDKGAYYGNRGNKEYFVHGDDFRVLDMSQARTDMAVDAVYRTFTVDESELMHNAQVYKHNGKSGQVWHEQPFGYMQNGDKRDIACRTEHVGKIAGVDHADTGVQDVTTSHTFYEITCDMNGDGTYTPLLR